MLDGLRNQWDRLRGTGVYSMYSPNLDGAFRHNSALDTATKMIDNPAPGNLAVLDGQVVFTSGSDLKMLEGVVLRSFDAPVSCLAVSPRGRILACLEDGSVTLDGEEAKLDAGLPCPTAAVFEDEESVLIANGSAEHGAADWKRDLLLKGQSGSIWRVSLQNGKVTRIADGLAWPSAMMIEPDGRILVAECWRHRLVSIPPGGGRAEIRIDGLPGYPNSFAPCPEGGFWLSFLSIRNQLIEFILTEKTFVRRMLDDVPPEFWIAPTYRSGASFKEPIQGSGIKHMGVLKPWAATRSYGLIARFNERSEPIESLHSRVDGGYHGVSSVLHHDGALFFASRGAEKVARLDIGDAS